MEGEQKVDLPLDGELDIKSSDMLVTVNEAKFAHNRQRWQGHCLPSSLRYEHDGWAAGWDVYDIKYNDRDVKVESVSGVEYKIRRYYYNDNKAYKIVILNADDEPLGSFIYNTEAVIGSNSLIARGINVTDNKNGTFAISMQVEGKEVTCTYNILTNELTNVSPASIIVSAGIADNAQINFTVKDTDSTIDVHIDKFNIPTAMYAHIGVDSEVVLGQFKSFVKDNTTGTYTWQGVAYRVVISRVNDQYNMSVYYGEGVSPVVTKGVTIVDGVLSSDDEHIVSFNLTASASVSYVGNVNQKRIDEITAIEDSFTSDHVTLCTDLPTDWDKQYDYTYKYTITEAKEPVTYTVKTKLDNKYANMAKLETQHIGNLAKLYIPQHVSVVFKYHSDSPMPLELYIFENDVDVTDKYSFTYTYEDDQVVSCIIWCSPDTILQNSADSTKPVITINLKGMTCYPYFSYDSDHYTAIADVGALYSGIRGKSYTADANDNTTMTILPYLDNSSKNNLHDLFDMCAVNINDIINKSFIYFDTVIDNSLYFIADITILAPIVYMATANKDTLQFSSTDYIGSLNRTSNNVFTVSAKDNTTTVTSGMYIANFSNQVAYDIRPTYGTNIFFNTASSAAITLTPYARSKFISMIKEGTELDFSDITPLPSNTTKIYIPANVTNSTLSSEETEQGTDSTYIKGYDLLNLNCTVKSRGIQYLNSLAAHYKLSSDNVKSDLSENILPSLLGALTVTAGAPGAIVEEGGVSKYKQDITVMIAGANVSKTVELYAVSNQLNIPAVDAFNFDYNGYTINVGFTAVSADVSTVSASGTATGNARMTIEPTALPYVSDGDITAANTISVSFNLAGKSYVYDIVSNTIEYGDNLIKNVTTLPSDKYYCIELLFNYIASAKYNVILNGPTLFNNIEADSYDTDNKSILQVSGEHLPALTIDMNEVINQEEPSDAIITATDIRDAALTDKTIQKIESNDVYQIIKQQWNTTTEVENYWWLDADNILVLDKSKITLLTKGNGVTPWAGDKWVKSKVYERTDYIDSGVQVYNCTSAYKSTALFYTIRIASDREINVAVYDMKTGLPVYSEPVHLYINIIPLGEALIDTDGSPTEGMCTYSSLTAQQLIAKAKVTATVVDGKFIIGIHYDNNFNQWVFIKSLTGSDNVHRVHGYGFVGVDGALTGGEIPYKYFAQTADNMGFSGSVQDIDTLNKQMETGVDKEYAYSIAELFTVNERVVGTDDRQWYISSNIDSIVSHLTYDPVTHAHVPQRLYLNNNYKTVYASGSYAAQVVGDSQSINVDTLYNLLNIAGSNVSFESVFNTSNNTTIKDAYNDQSLRDGGIAQVADHVVSAFTNFNIFSYSPILSCINYVQQTVGQYAYVHYNSSDVIMQHDILSEAQSMMEGLDTTRDDKNGVTVRVGDKDKVVSTVSSDELAFDTQIIRQSQSCETAWPSSFMILITIASTVLDTVASKLQINSNNNQMTIAGQGTATQLYSQALNSLSLSDLQVRKSIPTQISEVPAIKTLDMFYSTSAAQKVWAGPGFVNHNFVAQCAAQSVTSLQLELNQQKLQWIIKIMSEAIQMALVKVFDGVADYINAYTVVYTGHLWWGTVAIAISRVFMVLAALAKSKLEMMDSILDALGGDHAQINTIAALSKHTYDVEGKHKYGNSSKAFMWPCFGCSNNGQYTDEYVDATAQNKKWYLDTPTAKGADIRVLMQAEPNANVANSAPFVTATPDTSLVRKFTGNVNYFIAMCKGGTYNRDTPKDMAYIIGTESFLSKDTFKNDTIGEDAPVFSAPLTQDYMLNGQWEIGATATMGEVAWVSVRDTKVIDGAPSNIVISDDFCGIASSYTAVEVKRGITKKYMRPETITPTALSLNCTNMNTIFDEKVYHGFDGYGSRIVSWTGIPGMNKEKYTLLYAFITNDRFKRSNKIAPNQLLGSFRSDPIIDMPVMGNDKLHIQVMQPSDNRGLLAAVPGEDKDVLRYAVPVFTEYVNTLPAVVKTLSAYSLAVVEGITSLCTDIRNTQAAYKVPVSVDFNIGAQLYRATQEYICKLTNTKGVVVIENLVPILGLTFLGASPYEAYFYSQATRLYYVYTGGTEIRAVDTVERFRDVKNGYWDFVNQEVVMPCVATFDRLDSKVHDDDDETDNIIIPVIKNGAYRGEVPPPVTTIFNTESWFKTYSLPSGVVFQGPDRCIINRFVWSDYMLPSVLDNRGKWKKVPREEYHPYRQYDPGNKVTGWTHNPFLLVTSPLGLNEETDCKFEWEITFAWTVEMDKLYTSDNYACVNVVAETMEPGGKVYSRPTHIFLTKELFTRTGNYGYYSFRYQSNNGIGNRERLHIWADSYIAISSVQCAYVPKTTRRTEVLTQQIDVKGLKEM